MIFQKILDFIFSFFNRTRTKVNPDDYPKPDVDYGTLTPDQQAAMKNILGACENSKDTVDIPTMSQEDFDAMVCHISMHFGNADLCKNIALKRGNTALVNLELYAQAVAHKAELDARIESALVTIDEGTIEDKLKQVCKYIARHSRYKYGTNDPLALLAEGGMCGAYSMIFYKMATRLGVQAYICYGQAWNGVRSGAHAWNMVKLNGVDYFYDATFYDGNYDPKYIRSETSWDRTYLLNDQSGLTIK